MENQVINDPQQYCEEWFNTAIPSGKEFDLPNISNTFNQMWIQNDYMAMPYNTLQIPLNQTNPLMVDFACDTGNQYFPLPRVGATPVLVENQQVYTTGFITNPSLPISQNPICVQSVSTTQMYGLSSLITMRNQQFHVPMLNSLSSPGINFPMTKLHTHVHRFLNPPCLYPNISIHARYQQPHFSGIVENPITCCNHGIMSNITDPNGSIHMTAKPMHAPIITNARYSCSNSRPMSNQENLNVSTHSGNQPIHMPNIASTSRSCSSNGNLMSNKGNHHGPSCFDGSILIKNQETNAPNAHFVKPKQEPIASNAHLIKPKQEEISSSQLNVGPNQTSHPQNPTKKPSSPSKDSKPPKIQEKKGKKKTIESQSVPEGHNCFVCNLTFASGHALGGHMSSHAKKRKMEAMRKGLLFLKSGVPFVRFGNGSDHTPKASTITSDSVAAADEKIKRRKPLNIKQEEQSTKIDVEKDGSSRPFKVPGK